MQWIQHLSKQGQQSPFKKLDKFTLHNHNYVSQVNQKQKTFSCILHLKKINRIFNTVCHIDGDMKSGKIQVTCYLLNQQHIFHGKWQYQKVQLTKFAFRYNQRSEKNIFIRTNPVTGDISVVLSFLTGQNILDDDVKFRELITDLCHNIGEESQMIFNTMLQIIFGIEANEPYLQSAIKVNPGFPRYMKVQKLLDKLKSLITTSSFYKIRSDISSAHKNRSYFKKMYLNQQKKMIYNQKIIQMALLYEPKFNRRYQQYSKKPKDRNNHFIKDYIELEQKNQVQFAKHLNQGYQKELQMPVISTQPFDNLQQESDSGIYHITFGNQVVKATVVKMGEEEYQHQMTILKILQKKHPNMSLHISPSNLPSQASTWMFYLYQQQIPLLQYLKKNSLTISLSTKLHIMSQVCFLMQYMHKKGIVYFIQIQNIFITRALQVRVRGFYRSYKVNQWLQLKKQEIKPNISYLIMRQEEMKEFPYRFVKINDMDNQKCDITSLGVCLYRILMDKFPFLESTTKIRDWNKEEWLKMWVVETQFFLCKGGQIVKILGHLLLKCMELEDIGSRPYVQWLLVILCEVKISLNGLY